jgi:hypothetical protein
VSDVTFVKEAAPGTPSANNTTLYVDTADNILKTKTEDAVVHNLTRSSRSLTLSMGDVFFGGEQGGTAPRGLPIGVDIGSLPNQVSGVTLADAFDSGVNCKFMMPIDASTATVTVRPIWSAGATDGVSHAVAWRMNVKILTGADVTAAGTSIAWTGASAARTVNVQVVEPGQATTAVTPAAGEIIRIALSRDGAAAADSYVGDVNLLYIRIDYTSVD